MEAAAIVHEEFDSQWVIACAMASIMVGDQCTGLCFMRCLAMRRRVGSASWSVCGSTKPIC